MGDPVDTVTGAQVEVVEEFRLPGVVPLAWIRRYDSSKVGARYGLGWGHAHDYERTLCFDADGLRYSGPLGMSVEFPFLERDGDQATIQAFTLRRIGVLEYQIDRTAEPTMEFRFASQGIAAPLGALVRCGVRLEFRYREDGALAGIAERPGRSIRVESDGDGRVRRMVLVAPDGGADRLLIAYDYDARGNLTRGQDAYGHEFSFEYDQANRIVRRVDRRGYSFRFAFDERGRCVQSEGQDGLLAVRLMYEPDQKRTLVTKADGGVWEYRYDDRKLLVAVHDPYGGVQIFRYDEMGRVVEEVDPNGDVTVWLYDGDRNFVGMRSSLGHVSFDGSRPLRPDQQAHRMPSTPLQWEYGDLALKEQPATGTEHSVASELSSLVRLVLAGPTSSRAVGAATPHGQPAGAERSEARTLTDALGTLLRQTDVEGRTRSWAYDAGGNTTRSRDYDGGAVRCDYDSWDLPVLRVDAIGRRLTRRFTSGSQVAEEIDAVGVSTSYTYDLKGRVSSRSYNGTLSERYEYDLADNLVRTLDGSGRPIVLQEFGPRNLRRSRRLASGETHLFEHTERGQYKLAVTPTVTVQFEYDEFFNRTRDEQNGRGVRHAFAGPGTLTRTTVLGRFTTTYRRTAGGQLEIRDPGGSIHRLQFLSHGVSVRKLANGTAEVAQFDSAGRCRSKAVAGARGRTPWLRHYRYSGEGDLVEVRDSAAGVTQFAYDGAHRLREAVLAGGARERFVLDEADNLLEQDGLRQVEIGAGHRIRRANGEEFAYDARGNVSARHGQGRALRYRYDSRDMLVACDTPRGEWLATYDALGRRVRTTIGQEWTEFYWDTDRLAAERHHDGRVRVYVYADAFALVPLLWLEYEDESADPSSGRRCYPFYNHLGTPVRVEADSGDVVWAATVSAFGTMSVHTGSRAEVTLRFPGHFFDADLDLHYNRFRYYDPVLGRYIQPDPLGTANGTNPYAYSANPLRDVDLRGDCRTDGTQTDQPQTAEDGDAARGLKPGQFRDEDGRLRNADGTFAPEPRGPYSNFDDHPSVGPGKDFTEAQKAKIIAENMRRNGGVVRSDDPNDPHQILVQPAKSQEGVTPPQNEWQIDHIVAKDKGGTNSYSNARVISRQLNRQKSNN